MVLLLLICCLVCFPSVVGVLCLSYCALLCVLSSFAIILKRKRELVALLLFSYGCLVTVNVLWLFLSVPWVDLRCVIVVFPDHTPLTFCFTLVLGKRNKPTFWLWNTSCYSNLTIIQCSQWFFSYIILQVSTQA